MKVPLVFSGKKVTLFGLGLHGGGVGTARFLSQAGAKVTVTDIKTADQLRVSVRALKEYKNISFVLGQNRPEDFDRADMVVISPAIQWSNPYVQRALKHNIPVEMDASLFCKLCPCPVVGVTGTKGKTTTSLLTYQILEHSQKNPVEIGIGQTSVLDKLPVITKENIAVFELSSWRLSSLGRNRMSPHVGVFTNFLPDHLNYYGSMDRYFEDKKEICRYQTQNDFFVANYEDSRIRSLADELPSRVIFTSFRDPESAYAVFVDNREIIVRWDGKEQPVATLDDIRVRGRHNISNVLLAIGAARSVGATVPGIQSALRSFHGAPHRLELVAEKRGVKFYNDTAATIPQAVISALHSFTQPVVLIAGGSDKGLRYDEFAETVVENAKDIILLEGKAGDAMRAAINGSLAKRGIQKSIASASSMDEAVRLAASKANVNDIVLLSPGAASFGMFDNEFHRGEVFRECVKTL